MGLADRISARRVEKRAVEVPWRPWNDRYVPYDAGGPVHPSQASAGPEGALSLAPLFSGARLLADMVASLPLQCYRIVPNGPNVKAPMSQLLQKPSAIGTVYDWLFQMMVSLILTGNAWGYITSRDGYGYPTSVEWLPSNHVSVIDDPQQPWNPLRARIYFHGRQMFPEELFHIRAFTIPGKVEGLSPLRLFMTLIGAGNAALNYGASWFESGGFPPGTFQNVEEEVDKTSADEIRRRLSDSIRKREPLVYGRDWDYKPVVVPPSEAQFIESQQLTATQIAAILGIPPERIGGSRGSSLTYSTQEQESISLLTDTLRPWLVRIETALFEIMPAQQYVRFNSNAMLKTTTEARYQIYKLAREMGTLTANEIRGEEELPPLPGRIGDDPLPLEVLTAMARGIKEIPKSMESLVTMAPTDTATITSNEKIAASRPSPVTMLPGQPGALPAPGRQPPAPPGGRPAAQPSALAAAAAARNWLGDYEGPAPGELAGNGLRRY